MKQLYSRAPGTQLNPSHPVASDFAIDLDGRLYRYEKRLRGKKVILYKRQIKTPDGFIAAIIQRDEIYWVTLAYLIQRVNDLEATARLLVRHLESG